MPAKHVYELYIKTTPEKLWEAMTNSEFTKSYFGGTIDAEWRAGGAYRYKNNNEGGDMHREIVLTLGGPIGYAALDDTVVISDNYGNTRNIILSLTDISNGFVSTTFPKPQEDTTITVSASITPGILP